MKRLMLIILAISMSLIVAGHVLDNAGPFGTIGSVGLVLDVVLFFIWDGMWIMLVPLLLSVGLLVAGVVSGDDSGEGLIWLGIIVFVPTLVVSIIWGIIKI